VSAPAGNTIIPLCCCTHGKKLTGLEATLARLEQSLHLKLDREKQELLVSGLAGTADRQALLATLQGDGFLCDCRPIEG